MPVTGTDNNGKLLKAGATAGSLVWDTISKADVGLSNVDNTSDLNKPISTDTQAALDGKSATTHMHTAMDVGAAPLAHTHAIADVSGLQTTLDGKQALDADLTAIAGLVHLVSLRRQRLTLGLLIPTRTWLATNQLQ